MNRLEAKSELGKCGVEIPPVIFGTSCLGNLYRALDDDTKLAIMKEWFRCVASPVAADSAGKYGAGLALEVIGNGLRELGIQPDDVTISNKLAWVRTPLLTDEPTFEPGVWEGLEYDAEQRISADGIVECWEQGCELLGAGYQPDMVSVHDPDEYLAAAESEDDRKERFDDIVGAYTSLTELRRTGETKAVGIGSKDWKVIREVLEAVELDWVMLACSLTIMNHPGELLDFVAELNSRGVGIINSAVFHAGFLTGGVFYDYRRTSRGNNADAPLFEWRDKFEAICRKFDVLPAEACVQFGMSAPGVISIALNTSKPYRVEQNAQAVQADIPEEFWRKMKEEELISADYPYVG